MAQLGVPPATVANALRAKNLVSNSGRARVGDEYIAIEPSGLFTSIEDFDSLLISGSNGGAQTFLGDIATVRRDYEEPPSTILRYDGHRAIGVGISTVSGGNVVTMGKAVEQRIRAMAGEIPLGIEFGVISLQSEAVTVAINGFVFSLGQAIAIVVAVLLAFMGMRSGLLIGFVLFLTICGSFILMGRSGVTLERISLGALIIALGMLVDNAIVVVDGMLIKLQQGMDRRRAAIEVVKQTALPLLGATVIAVLAFAAIGTSQDSTGEYTRSLYTVILISLMLSWVTAITFTPLLATRFLSAPASGGDDADPYGSRFYQVFRSFLATCIRLRWATLAVVVAVFAAAVVGFGSLSQSFFPNSTRPQFMVDYWLPEGTHIAQTSSDMAEIEEHIASLDGVTHVTTIVGQGALRFLRTYGPEKNNSAYGQFLVDVDDYRRVDEIMGNIQTWLETNYPQADPQTRKFVLGPGEPGKIQAKFFGPDADVLRGLAARAETIMAAEPTAVGVRHDWREKVKLIRPVIAEEQANLNGITREDIANALRQGFDGISVGVFRESDELLPIVMRAREDQSGNIQSINNLQIYSPAARRMIPLAQVVSGFETVFEDQIIWRFDRTRAITVLADPRVGEAADLLAKVRPAVEAIELPPGYRLEWWGELRDSGDAQGSLAATIPLFILMMVLITILLFNNLKQTAVIWLTVPLAIIGVTVGLGVTGQPFGFMALLGFLSLTGMLIKNAIVLIDQINLELDEGKAIEDAILHSAVSRLRPVGMAAATTILGMAPLFPDAFFVSMAVTIAFGLGFATLLTMIVVPVLYAVFFRAPNPA